MRRSGETAPAGGRDWWARCATLALLALALPTEWSLAVRVLRLPEELAWLVPVIVELYVWRALELRRDRVLAMGIFLASVTTAGVVHMVEAEGHVLDTSTRAFLLLAFFAAGVVAVVRLGVMGDPRVAREVREVVPVAPAPVAHEPVAAPAPGSWEELDATFPEPGGWGTGAPAIDRGAEWARAWGAAHGRPVGLPLVAARMGVGRDQQPRGVMRRLQSEVPRLRAVEIAN